MREAIMFRLGGLRNVLWLFAFLILGAGAVLLTVFFTESDVGDKDARFYAYYLLLLGTPVLVAASMLFVGGTIVSAVLMAQQANQADSDALLEAIEGRKSESNSPESNEEMDVMP